MRKLEMDRLIVIAVTGKFHDAYARPEIQRENIARAEAIFRKPTGVLSKLDI